MARTTNHERHKDLARRGFAEINRRGLHNITMSDLATALGVKRPTLYWYFDSPADIIRTVGDGLIEQRTAYVADRLEGVVHPLERVATWMRAVVDFHCDQPELVAALTHRWSSASVEMRKAHHAMRETITDWLQDGVDQGKILPCMTHEIADLCAATLDGALVQLMVGTGQPSTAVDRFCEKVLEPLREKGAADHGILMACYSRRG